MTVGSNDPSRVVNAVFYLSPFFIYILLYSYCKSNLVNNFLVLIYLKSKSKSNCIKSDIRADRTCFEQISHIRRGLYQV